MTVRCLRFVPYSTLYPGEYEYWNTSFATSLNIQRFLLSKLRECEELLASYGVEEVWLDSGALSVNSCRKFPERRVPLFITTDEEHTLDGLAEKMSRVFGFNVVLMVSGGCLALHGCVPLYGIEPSETIDWIFRLGE